MAEIMISIAGKTDIPALHQLVNSAYRGEYSRKGWTTEADFLDGIRVNEEGLLEMMNNPGAVILKAVSADNITGCVYLQVQDNLLYLGMLTVSPELQNQGLGKMMLQKAEEYGQLKGCNGIIMNVLSKRTELIQWYERHGYFITGETKPFPDDPKFGIPKQPLEFIVMKKMLS